GALMILDLTIVESPVGPLALLGTEGTLLGLTLDGGHDVAHPVLRHVARHLGKFTLARVEDAAGAATRLARYFGGDLAALDEQPVRMLGSQFQVEVWSALRTIGPGATRSYSAVAVSIGRPDAVRAVAAANGANPVALF